LIKNITRVFSENYFFFEHGAFPSNGNTCGVDHAHIHILPVGKEVSATVIGFITKTYYSKPYKNFLFSLKDETDMPYLLFGNNVLEMYSCNNINFSSQFIRKILCSTLGIKDWNWRNLTNGQYFTNALYGLMGKIHA
jgi:hypothetical protein